MAVIVKNVIQTLGLVFWRFSLWHSPFTENSSTEQFCLGCHVITPASGFLITVTMFHFQTSSLFAARVLFLPIPQQYYQKFTLLDGEPPPPPLALNNTNLVDEQHMPRIWANQKDKYFKWLLMVNTCNISYIYLNIMTSDWHHLDNFKGTLHLF